MEARLRQEEIKLPTVIRPMNCEGLLNHKLCVVFPCGLEITVSRNTAWALTQFQSKKEVQQWARELFITKKICPYFRLLQ